MSDSNSPINIEFRKQINENYSAATCIQMLTQTEENQQDIYFRMLRIMQNLKPADYSNKALFHTPTQLIVGPKERLCKLIEDTLNHFKKNDVFWDVQIGRKLEEFPAFAVFYPRRTQMNHLLKGHPVVITKIEEEKVTIYDPVNDEPVSILKMRLSPLISSYFILKQTYFDGTPLEPKLVF